MKEPSKLLTINLNEARLLFLALHQYSFGKTGRRKELIKKKATAELLELDKAYESLKSFIDSFYSD